MSGIGWGEAGERLRRSTVQINCGRGSCGSGTIWQADGLIVTNSHVVSGGTPTVTMWDGRTASGRVACRDAARDLLSLRIPLSGLPSVSVRDSTTLKPGELLIAVGNPLGFVGALTTGSVQASGGDYVRADIRLAPGNSGGPLADASGHVVGINTMVFRGLGIAVASRSVETFLQHGPVKRLGVAVRPVESGRLLILEIEEGSAAERASLLPGDVLLENHGGLLKALASSGPVTLRFLRGGSPAVRQVVADLARQEAKAA